MMKRKRANLPAEAIDELTAFVKGRELNPYATPHEKEQLARKCDITQDQVANWLTNYRKRRWNPPDWIEISVAAARVPAHLA
mmetsp:Transcript_17076/g.43760  ORF Transcript_17076/g.43760 Transcript_17076/m.43760 type:complete len:82 (+) Transcript_17076:729-974(+)